MAWNRSDNIKQCHFCGHTKDFLLPWQVWSSRYELNDRTMIDAVVRIQFSEEYRSFRGQGFYDLQRRHLTVEAISHVASRTH